MDNDERLRTLVKMRTLVQLAQSYEDTLVRLRNDRATEVRFRDAHD